MRKSQRHGIQMHDSTKQKKQISIAPEHIPWITSSERL
jgi:hypothetical protein